MDHAVVCERGVDEVARPCLIDDIVPALSRRGLECNLDEGGALTPHCRVLCLYGFSI